MWDFGYDCGSLNYFHTKEHMAIEDTLNSIDTTLKAILLIAQSGQAGAALVGTPAGTPTPAPKPKAVIKGDADGTRYFHHVADKKLHKVLDGFDHPIGTVEVTPAEYTKLEKKYAEGNAAAGATGSAASAPASAPPAAGATGAQTTGTATAGTGAGPSFQDVTKVITEMAKQADGVGRAKLVTLLAHWKVEKFPMVNGKIPNDQLLKDITTVDSGKALEAAAAEPEGEDLSALGL